MKEKRRRRKKERKKERKNGRELKREEEEEEEEEEVVVEVEKGQRGTGGGMDHCCGIQYQGITGKLRSLPRWVQYILSPASIGTRI